MICPTCGTWTVVKETRKKEKNVTYRRYECGNLHRFTTLETVNSIIKPKANHANSKAQLHSEQKADNLVAALCMSCHYDIDQGAKWSKRERQQAWVLAHMKTVQALTDAGTWPVDIPIPMEAQLERLL